MSRKLTVARQMPGKELRKAKEEMRNKVAEVIAEKKAEMGASR